MRKFIILPRYSWLMHRAQHYSLGILYGQSALALCLLMGSVYYFLITPAAKYINIQRSHIERMQHEYEVSYSYLQKIPSLKVELSKLQSALSGYAPEHIAQYHLRVLNALHEYKITILSFKLQSTQSIVSCEIQGSYEQIMMCVNALRSADIPLRIKKVEMHAQNAQLTASLILYFYGVSDEK